LKAIFNKVDQYLLTRYPRLWVLGVHIFIPIVAATWLVLVIIGAVIVNTSNAGIYDMEDSFEQIGVGMILPLILLVILFIIRQAKYNAIRVHTHLPYKHRFMVFLAFWLVLFSISSLPFATYFGSWFIPGLNHNELSFENDKKVLEPGMSHIHLKGCYDPVARYRDDDYESKILSNYTPCDYRLDKTNDSLYVLRYDWDYDRYYANRPDRISMEDAYLEIEQSIEVAKKYKAQFKLEDAAQIIEMNARSRSIPWDTSIDRMTYSHMSNRNHFDRCIGINESYHSERQMFWIFDWEFWRYYSLVAFSLAFLLIIYCSVDKGEFGWAMLVCALMPTVYGILYGLLSLMNIVNGEASAKFLLAVFMGISAFIAFASKYKPKLKRIFGISLNMMLPIVLPLFIDVDFDDDGIYATYLFMLGLIVTWIYTLYYRLQYLHPTKT
jgi:hypothetical protein